MTRALAAGLALALLSSGCKGQCRQLSERLCECTADSTARDTCMRQAANNEGRVAPTADDEARCAALLPGCDCHLVNTAQGKVACGLARALDGGT